MCIAPGEPGFGRLGMTAWDPKRFEKNRGRLPEEETVKAPVGVTG